MIPLSEINRFSRQYNVPAETIEKDYVISWILYCLSKSELKQHFVFYGGTAIKRIYFETHRFSEDIDLLSSKKFSLDMIREYLQCLDYATKESNLNITINEENIISDNERIQLYLSYDGFSEIVGVPKEIRLDFSMNMIYFGKNSTNNIIETYSDLKNKSFNLSVMTLNTILSNKLGLLFDNTRNEPRDLYDIWFLLNRREEFNFDLNEILQTCKEKYSFTLTGKSIIRKLNNDSMKSNWSSRLDKQFPDLPSFEDIKKSVEENIKEVFDDEYSEYET